MFPWLICVIIDVAMHHVDWSMNSGNVSWYCQKHCARIFRAFQNWICSIFPQHPLFLHQSHASLWFVARWQSIPSTFHRSHLSCCNQDYDLEDVSDDHLASALNQSNFSEAFPQLVHTSRLLLLLLLLPLLLLLLLDLPQELLLDIGDISKWKVGVSNCFSQLLPCFPSSFDGWSIFVPQVNVEHSHLSS